MTEQKYVVHDRIRLRQRSHEEGTRERETADRFAALVEHILEAYPDNGPLRSMALRRLSESLDDILDHGALMQAVRERIATETASNPYPPINKSYPVTIDG